MRFEFPSAIGNSNGRRFAKETIAESVQPAADSEPTTPTGWIRIWCYQTTCFGFLRNVQTETTAQPFLKRYPNANLTVAGAGPLRSSLEKLAADLRIGGRIQFKGFVPQSELLTLYLKSHIFLHPSEQTPNGDREGVPNSLLEAMATGLPCIATRHGGIPEAITHLKSGILVPESDLASLADWLDRLAADDHLRDSLGRNAARTIEGKFALTTQIEKLEEIYLGLRRG